MRNADQLPVQHNVYAVLVTNPGSGDTRVHVADAPTLERASVEMQEMRECTGAQWGFQRGYYFDAAKGQWYLDGTTCAYGVEQYHPISTDKAPFSAIRVITCHDGAMNQNGGEYGFWYTLQPHKDGWAQVFNTSAQFEYCCFRGGFTRCLGCSEYYSEEGECLAGFDVLDQKDVNTLLANHPWRYEDVNTILVDATGHEADTRETTGCRICHPCTR